MCAASSTDLDAAADVEDVDLSALGLGDPRVLYLDRFTTRDDDDSGWEDEDEDEDEEEGFLAQLGRARAAPVLKLVVSGHYPPPREYVVELAAKIEGMERLREFGHGDDEGDEDDGQLHGLGDVLVALARCCPRLKSVQMRGVDLPEVVRFGDVGSASLVELDLATCDPRGDLALALAAALCGFPSLKSLWLRNSRVLDPFDDSVVVPASFPRLVDALGSAPNLMSLSLPLRFSSQGMAGLLLQGAIAPGIRARMDARRAQGLPSEGLWVRVSGCHDPRAILDFAWATRGCVSRIVLHYCYQFAEAHCLLAARCGTPVTFERAGNSDSSATLRARVDELVRARDAAERAVLAFSGTRSFVRIVGKAKKGHVLCERDGDTAVRTRVFQFLV